MTPIRLVLADDHAIVLHGLKRLFEGHPDFRVVECCVDGAGAVAAARDDTCDVLVLDLRMPGRTGLDVLKTLAAEKRRCRTILLTAAISDDDVVEAVRLGARGVVLKESSPETLLECVRRVYRGEQWIDRETMTRALRPCHAARSGDARGQPDSDAARNRDRPDDRAGPSQSR